VIVVIRPKDVLESLCKNAEMPFLKVKNRPTKWGLIGLGLFLIEKTFEVAKIVRREKPDMLVGSDGVLAFVGKICKVPSFEWYEDDVDVIKLYAKMFFPLYTNVVSPTVCNAGKWKYKQITYSGYQKLAYWHPKYFTPDKSIVEKYFSADEPYFLLRFAQLTAHHDQGVCGFTTDVAQHVIDLLSPHGKVYISSEKELPPQFERYRMKINPLDIHHILYYSVIYVGDSQSMAVEASMLGVPAIRFNDFVGEKKISVLEELEHVYGLTYAIHSSQTELLFEKISELLGILDLRQEWQRRRQKMLNDKIDVTAFYTWFIENYPESGRIMNFNPDYQLRFK
jgi:predicted glycosyltransferase